MLRGLTAGVERGEFVAVLGKNGAGKSTLLRALASITELDRGRITINETPLVRDSAHVRRLIGYLAHDSFLYYGLTARQNLYYYGMFYDVDDLDKKIDEALRSAHLYLVRNEVVRTFSRGMVKKLSIARSMLHEPLIYLMDEPFSGLDTQSAEAFTTKLQDLRDRGKTVILVTHRFSYALELADTVWLLCKGKIQSRIPSHSLDSSSLQEAYMQCINDRP